MTHPVMMMRMLPDCFLLFVAFAWLSPGVETGRACRRLQSSGSASALQEIPQFLCFHFGVDGRALESVIE